MGRGQGGAGRGTAGGGSVGRVSSSLQGMSLADVNQGTLLGMGLEDVGAVGNILTGFFPDGETTITVDTTTGDWDIFDQSGDIASGNLG